MAERSVPEWFSLGEKATPETMKRIAASVEGLSLPLQVKHLPLQAHWFVLDSLLLANQANREGMHANALSLTRQCIEAISIIETGICGHPAAPSILMQWDEDSLTPGGMRKWLSENVWTGYGSGLWSEPWADFMGKLAKAIQPYAHYSSQLAKWQLRLHAPKSAADGEQTLLIEYAPRAYDAQKATRITLLHAILTFALARIWMAHTKAPDPEFSTLIDQLRVALGRSQYLDGHGTDWEQQFWATVWSKQGGTVLE
jgi:hypothetical protein